MSKVPAIVPISDLRDDAANVLERMKKSQEPVVITQRGRAAAVIVSIEEYERSEHERELLRLLVQGDKEVASGRGHALGGRVERRGPDSREVKVRFTASARSQFLAKLEYVNAENPAAAAALLARAKKSLRRLATHPQSGRMIPEFPELKHRELIVSPYRFFYRVGKSTVWIVAVWHGAQNPRPE